MSEQPSAENDAAVAALREAANDARAMHDPPAPDCAEWADWLDARADRIEQARITPPVKSGPWIAFPGKVPVCQDCGTDWQPVRRGECIKCGSDKGPLDTRVTPPG